MSQQVWHIKEPSKLKANAKRKYKAVLSPVMVTAALSPVMVTAAL
jgi:hypothetical protein